MFFALAAATADDLLQTRELQDLFMVFDDGESEEENKAENQEEQQQEQYSQAGLQQTDEPFTLNAFVTLPRYTSTNTNSNTMLLPTASSPSAAPPTTPEQYNTMACEMRDYLRTGDSTILRRLMFRLFVATPCPPMFAPQKACALVQIMACDPSFVPQVTVSSRADRPVVLPLSVPSFM